jgi:hypothetical protein
MTVRDFARTEFWWAIHNLAAHPLSQLLWWASLCGLVRPLAKAGDMVHDWTVPNHNPGTGRG